MGKKIKKLNYIFVIPRKGYYNGLFDTCIDGSQRFVWVTYYGTISGADIIYLAGIIIHEIRHIKQKNNKRRWSGSKAELEAAAVQRAFLVKYGVTGHVVWLDKQMHIHKKWWLAKGTIFADTMHKKFLKLLKNHKLIIRQL